MRRAPSLWRLSITLVTMWMLVGAPVGAAPVVPFETSADGHETALVPEAEGLGVVTGRGPGPLPFGTAPDWFTRGRRLLGGVRAVHPHRNGWVDLVTVCYNSMSFPPYEDWHNLVYFNGPGGLETTASWTSTDEVSTGDLTLGDFDGNGWVDVFAANGGTAMAPSRIYFNGPGGLSTTAGWTEGTTTWTNFAIAFDLDHDGDVDVATANQGNSQANPFRPMQLFLNNDGVLATTPIWTSDETSIQNYLAFGDLDGDGWEDLAVSKWINFESGVYKNVAGTLQTTPMWTTLDDGDDKGIGFADRDGDLDLDLAVGHDPTRSYRNDAGTPVLDWNASGGFFGPSDVLWEDVDRDGDPDLAEVHFANGVVNVYRNDGGTLETTPWWSFDSTAVGTALAFGDVDRDGMPDLIVGNAGDVSLMVFFNQLPVPFLFTDGFESGDTAAWSLTVP